MLRKVTTIFQHSANPLRRVLASRYLFLVPQDFRNSETARPWLQLTIRHLWQMSLCPFHRPGVASSLAPPPTWGGLGNLLESTVSVQACSSPKLLSRERLCSYFTIFQLVLETLTSELLGEGVRATWAPSNKTPGWGFVSHMVSVSVTQFCPCWCSSHRHSKGTWLCANKTWFTKSGLGADSVCCSRSIYTELFLNGHYNFKGAFIATLVSHSPGRQISSVVYIHFIYKADWGH